MRTLKTVANNVAKHQIARAIGLLKTAFYNLAIVDKQYRIGRSSGRKNRYCTVRFKNNVVNIKHREDAFLTQQHTELFHFQTVTLKSLEVDSAISHEE